MIQCAYCGVLKPSHHFDDLLDYDELLKGNEVIVGKIGICFACMDDQTERALQSLKKRDNYKDLRERVIIALGGKCAVCGITDGRVLQIDHKDGKGAEDRRKHKRGYNSNTNYLTHILENPSNYQILCANHNWIKRYDNNEHLPRKTMQ